MEDDSLVEDDACSTSDEETGLEMVVDVVKSLAKRVIDTRSRMAKLEERQDALELESKERASELKCPSAERAQPQPGPAPNSRADMEELEKILMDAMKACSNKATALGEKLSTKVAMLEAKAAGPSVSVLEFETVRKNVRRLADSVASQTKELTEERKRTIALSQSVRRLRTQVDEDGRRMAKEMPKNKLDADKAKLMEVRLDALMERVRVLEKATEGQLHATAAPLKTVLAQSPVSPTAKRPVPRALDQRVPRALDQRVPRALDQRVPAPPPVATTGPVQGQGQGQRALRSPILDRVLEKVKNTVEEGVKHVRKLQVHEFGELTRILQNNVQLQLTPVIKRLEYLESCYAQRVPTRTSPPVGPPTPVRTSAPGPPCAVRPRGCPSGPSPPAPPLGIQARSVSAPSLAPAPPMGPSLTGSKRSPPDGAASGSDAGPKRAKSTPALHGVSAEHQTGVSSSKGWRVLTPAELTAFVDKNNKALLAPAPTPATKTN